MVVTKLSPKTVVMTPVSSARKYERDNNVIFKSPGDIAKIDWKKTGWGDTTRRGFDMVVRIGDFADFANNLDTVQCSAKLHHGKGHDKHQYCHLKGNHGQHAAYYYAPVPGQTPVPGRNPRSARTLVLPDGHTVTHTGVQWHGDAAYTDANDQPPTQGADDAQSAHAD